MTKVEPIVNRVRVLKNEILYSSLTGNYKAYKTAAVEHAKLVCDNFELVKNLKVPSANVPLFSKPGLRILKVMLLDFFRIKTPEEKQLKSMAKELRKKQEAEKYINLKG